MDYVAVAVDVMAMSVEVVFVRLRVEAVAFALFAYACAGVQGMTLADNAMQHVTASERRNAGPFIFFLSLFIFIGYRS